jgi:hypothetical protein
VEWGTPKTQHVPCDVFICEKCIIDANESFRETLKSIPTAEMVPVATEEMNEKMIEKMIEKTLKEMFDAGGGTFTCRKGALVSVGLSLIAYSEWFFTDRRKARELRDEVVQSRGSRTVHFVIIARPLGKDRYECTPVVLAGSPKGIERRGSDDIYPNTFVWPREALERVFPQVDDFLAPDQSEGEVTYVPPTSLPDLSDVLYRGPTRILHLDEAIPG